MSESWLDGALPRDICLVSRDIRRAATFAIARMVLSEPGVSLALFPCVEKGRPMNHPADTEIAVNPPGHFPPVLPQSYPSLEQALTSLSIWVAQQQQGVADLVSLHGERGRLPKVVDLPEAAIDRALVAQSVQSRVVSEEPQGSNKAWR